VVHLNDFTKIKSEWCTLTEGPHTIEIIWAVDGPEELQIGMGVIIIDGTQEALVSDIDNDTMYVDTIKFGFTSRLEGKDISGVFYVDDFATSNSGYFGLP
jgi:hypothetical protein